MTSHSDGKQGPNAKWAAGSRLCAACSFFAAGLMTALSVHMWQVSAGASVLCVACALTQTGLGVLWDWRSRSGQRWPWRQVADPLSQ